MAKAPADNRRDIHISDPHPAIRGEFDPLRERYGLTWEQLLYVLVAARPGDDVFLAASFADAPDDVLDNLGELSGGDDGPDRAVAGATAESVADGGAADAAGEVVDGFGDWEDPFGLRDGDEGGA